MTWALKGGEIEKLDKEEELDYLEIRLQKLESRDLVTRRKSAEALAPYVFENRYIDEVRLRFAVQPPHPAQVIADAILGQKGDKKICMDGCQALAAMGPAAAPFASHALAVLMSNTDEEIRFEAARALGCLGPGGAKKSAKALGTRLDPDTEDTILVRFMVARSLGLQGPDAAEGAAAELAKSLEDKDRTVQNASATALAQIGPNAAKLAARALVKSMLEGTFEMRRLAMLALTSMGEECAGVAAYPVCRVLNNMPPCCRPAFHTMKAVRKKAPKLCDKCKAVGPFAAGTDFACGDGCKWDLCKLCFSKFQHLDVVLQRLAADAIFAMGAKTVQTCQVFLARALGDADEEVREGAMKTLEMGGCTVAMKGSMALYDKSSCPCGLPNCLVCAKAVEALSKVKLPPLPALEAGESGADFELFKPLEDAAAAPIEINVVPAEAAIDQDDGDDFGVDAAEPPSTPKPCPDCNSLLAWSNFAEGDYAEGWECVNAEICEAGSSSVGPYRWFCVDCQNDYCGKCGPPEPQDKHEDYAYAPAQTAPSNEEAPAQTAPSNEMMKPETPQLDEEAPDAKPRDPWGPAEIRPAEIPSPPSTADDTRAGSKRAGSKRPDLKVETGRAGKSTQDAQNP